MSRFRFASTLAFAFSLAAGAQHTMVMHTPESPESREQSLCASAWQRPIELFPPSLIGNFTHPVSTRKPKAQAYFDQGLMFYYGFDTLSAMQSFHAATQEDPNLAMGYWGVALAAGGDLNIPINDPCMELAVKQSRLALQNRSSANARDQAYVDAIARRYATDSTEPAEDRDPKQLAVRYMLATRGVYDRWFTGEPSQPDPDAAAMYAVALMNLRPWLWWTIWGTKSNEIELALQALEAGLSKPQLKNHLGLNHFYIHATEEGPYSAAIKALPSADLLMQAAPERTPHLRHMPAHTYLRHGDWDKVVQANLRAVAADQWWKNRCEPSIEAETCNPLLVGHYRSHDLLFLGVGYSNFGLWDNVRDTADKVEDNAKRFIAQQPGLEHYLTTRVMMYTHFGKWKDVAAIPPPQPLPDPHSPTYCNKLTFKLATAMYYFGQTMVDAEAFPTAAQLAAAGSPDRKNALQHANDKRMIDDLFAFNQASSCVADSDVGWGNNTATSILTVVHWRLLSRIALRQGAMQEAIEDARQAVQMEDLLNYDEPPGWYVYSRETLGAALLLSGDAKAALAVFDKNLEDHPNNSRALFGRWQALVKLGSPEAGAAEKQFRSQWTGKELPELRNM